MFVGNNRIQVNEATLVRMVQFWLNDQFKPGHAPTVKGISFSNGGLTSDRYFEIGLTDAETGATS